MDGIWFYLFVYNVCNWYYIIDVLCLFLFFEESIMFIVSIRLYVKCSLDFRGINNSIVMYESL